MKTICSDADVRCLSAKEEKVVQLIEEHAKEVAFREFIHFADVRCLSAKEDYTVQLIEAPLS